MKNFIAKNFRKPEGLFGNIISRLMEKGNMPAYLHLIDEMQLKGTESLFEIGYGPGKGMKHILDNTKCSVDGIDFSGLMFKRASRKNRKHIECGRSELFFGDINSGVIIKKKYDAVFFVNVIYFWNDLETSFDAIKKLLRKNGRIYFYMTELDDLLEAGFTRTDAFNKYRSEDVLIMLKQMGFNKTLVTYKTDCRLKGCYFRIDT